MGDRHDPLWGYMLILIVWLMAFHITLQNWAKDSVPEHFMTIPAWLVMGTAISRSIYRDRIAK